MELKSVPTYDYAAAAKETVDASDYAKAAIGLLGAVARRRRERAAVMAGGIEIRGRKSFK